jgi:hypothetical protein
MTSFEVGAMRCRILQDGTEQYPPEVVFANVTAAELAPHLASFHGSPHTVHTSNSPALVETQDQLILLDAGFGSLPEAAGEQPGRLQHELAALGIRPSDVDVVVVSHAHPDHVGGLTTPAEGGRSPTFDRAVHLITRAEWDLWTGTEDSVCRTSSSWQLVSRFSPWQLPVSCSNSTRTSRCSPVFASCTHRATRRDTRSSGSTREGRPRSTSATRSSIP